MESNMIRIGGLWINESKDGTKYMSGNWGPNIKLLIFKNKNKKPGSKDPDYSICLAPVESKEKEKVEAEEDLPF